MGKVFNDQIIKILCAKNFNKVQNDVGEPNLKEKCSCLRRGESYVVFLDRDHRKQLQRQMGAMDLKATPAEKSLCTIAPTTANNIDVKKAAAKSGVDENWLKRTLSMKRSAGGAAASANTLRAQICDSLCNVLPKRVTDMLTPRNPRGENEPITPSVFGPFLDEPVVGFIDRLAYFFYVLIGKNMEEEEAFKDI